MKRIVLATNDAFVTGGNSIGGYTALALAADDSATGLSPTTAAGVGGTGACRGLVLMNSAGKVLSREEAAEEAADETKGERTVAHRTANNLLPPFKSSSPLLLKTFSLALLAGLRPAIPRLTKWLYPRFPEEADKDLCDTILRDSLDQGAVNVMISGSKLPAPRTANELLGGGFGNHRLPGDEEGEFEGPVLVANGIADPLNDSRGRMEAFGRLREGIKEVPIEGAGHCPHDEAPALVAEAISDWWSEVNREAVEVGV